MYGGFVAQGRQARLLGILGGSLFGYNGFLRQYLGGIRRIAQPQQPGFFRFGCGNLRGKRGDQAFQIRILGKLVCVGCYLGFIGFCLLFIIAQSGIIRWIIRIEHHVFVVFGGSVRKRIFRRAQGQLQLRHGKIFVHFCQLAGLLGGFVFLFFFQQARFLLQLGLF
ncbi:hypothetical protein SDC9_197752 [bioreactor metagenome]|uniref:Uncharacterized protein n=1 Tax=bioreactor metagenome TaxID=1076179 RepID=A0A645IGM7_9ZZZZ